MINIVFALMDHSTLMAVALYGRTLIPIIDRYQSSIRLKYRTAKGIYGEFMGNLLLISTSAIPLSV